MQQSRQIQTSKGKNSHAIRENTLFTIDKKDRKNSFYQSLINRSFDLYKSKEADKSEFAFTSNPYDFMIFSGEKLHGKRQVQSLPSLLSLMKRKRSRIIGFGVWKARRSGRCHRQEIY